MRKLTLAIALALCAPGAGLISPWLNLSLTMLAFTLAVEWILID